MLVVYFVRFAQGAEIEIIGTGKQFETLMNEDVVHHKIGKAVKRDAQAYINEESPRLIEGACRKEGHGETRKNDEKGIVALKEIFLVFVVVVVVQYPQKSVHHILVCEPGNAFHGDESKQGNANIDKYIHVIF